MSITPLQAAEMVARLNRNRKREAPTEPAVGVESDLHLPSAAVGTRLNVRISTDVDKLNKTERAYYEYVSRLGFQWVGVQCLTLKLADDTRYTPDFVAVDINGALHAREVKGFFRDDAKVKIKVAARMYPWIRFEVVYKEKNGWNHVEVKP